jgi:hypothetical protein
MRIFFRAAIYRKEKMKEWMDWRREGERGMKKRVKRGSKETREKEKEREPFRCGCVAL